MSDTNNKKLRTILALVWAMLFCFNLILCLIIPDPSFLSWIIVGFMLGGLFIMLLDNSLLNMQDSLRDLQNSIIHRQDKIIEEYQQMSKQIYEQMSKTNKTKNKKKK